MRLLSFAVGDYVSFGAVSGDAVVDVGRMLGEQHPTLGAVLRGGELHRAVSLGGTSKPTKPPIPVSALTLTKTAAMAKPITELRRMVRLE